MKTLFTFFLGLLSITLPAQGSDWLWARSSYSSYPVTNGVTGLKVITDAAGDVYTIGTFYKTDLGFDTSAFKNIGGNSPYDAFIVKHSSKGEFRWARQISGTGNTQGDFISDICLDLQGNLLVAGSFNSRFLTIAGTKFTNIYNSTNDSYIAKIDRDGKFLWARQYGGIASQYISEIACNDKGEIFVAGQFNSSTMNFGSFTLTNNSTAGTYDMFIARLDSAGTPAWVKSYGGKDQEGSYGLALGKDGQVHFAAYTYSDSIYFENKWMKGGSMIHAVFDPLGAYVSAIMPGTGDISAIICDNSGDIIMAGNFYSSSTIRFGTLALAGNGNPNGVDFFVFKCKASGEPLWLRSGRGSGNDNHYNYNSINCLASDASGNIYAAGMFYNDSLSVVNHLFLNPYSGLFLTNIFILKYNSSGDLLATREIEGNDGKGVYGVCTDKNNDVYFTGSYSSSPCRFGKDLTLKPSVPGGSEIFIAKLSANATGLENIHDREQISLFPNPVMDELSLRFNSQKGQSGVNIFNLQGQLVISTVLLHEDSGGQAGINVSELPPGIYVLKLSSESSVLNLKFIKQ